MPLMLDAPPSPEQIAFNKARWRVLCADSDLAQLEWRVETDRLGRLIMSPPPKKVHGRRQSRIAVLLDKFLGEQGLVITECPVCTNDGVKGADVAWISLEREEASSDPDLFSDLAPEICVEVISPGNSAAEMLEKKALYFAAGAEEVWFCEQGRMVFYLSEAPNAEARSLRCPELPDHLGF